MVIRRFLSGLSKRLYQAEFKVLQSQVLRRYHELKEDEKNGKYRILETMLIYGEDRRFFSHPGFDPYAICRAIVSTLILNRPEGASTIEQQLVRVLLNSYERTARRKIREILLSTTIRDIIPQQHIPLLYLHVAYYGTGMDGIHELLGRLRIATTDEITIDLAAEIIARIKFPEAENPRGERIILYRRRVDRLVELYCKNK